MQPLDKQEFSTSTSLRAENAGWILVAVAIFVATFAPARAHGEPDLDQQTPYWDPQLPVMIEFHASYCSVCQRMEPLIDAITNQCDQNGVRIARWDVSEPLLEHLVDEYHIIGLPTFLFIDAQGHEVVRLVGYQEEGAILQALSALRGQPCPQIGRLRSAEAPPSDTNATALEPPTGDPVMSSEASSDVLSCDFPLDPQTYGLDGSTGIGCAVIEETP